MARRILVKGGSGSGKTTLATELARRLGVPHVELDALHHGPDWREASAEELRASVVAALDDARGWIVDGNYERKLGTLVLDRAELVVWLDLPLSLRLARLTRRSLRRIVTGETLWNGNRETIRGVLWGRDSLFGYTVRMHTKQQREWPVLLAGRNVARLRSRLQVAAFLTNLR